MTTGDADGSTDGSLESNIIDGAADEIIDGDVELDTGAALGKSEGTLDVSGTGAMLGGWLLSDGWSLLVLVGLNVANA